MIARLKTARTLLLTTFVAVAALALPTSAGATELIYATTPSNVLISFTAQAPSRIVSTRALSGMLTSEAVIGMDHRPETGQLFALTNQGRVLLIERDSGVVKRVGSATIARTGTSFGFEVNPNTDRIRLVSDADRNIRINPDTGALGSTDTNLAYGAGDAGAGTSPNVTALAHTASIFGGVVPTAVQTILYGIDVDRNTLVRQDPNAGTLTTVGALGIDPIGVAQFDSAADQALLAAFATSATGRPMLWRVATTGAATRTTSSATLSTLPAAITAMATVGQVNDDTTAPSVAVGNFTAFRNVWRSKGLRMTTACNEGCTVTVTLKIRGRVAGTAAATMPVAGTRAPRITLTRTGRALAAAAGNIPCTLTFVSRDAAGLSRTQVSSFTSRASA